MVTVGSPGPGFQAEVLAALHQFWDGRDVRHLHQPVWFRQFGAAALAARTPDGTLVGYLLGHCTPTLAYVHAVAVHPGSRGSGVARDLYEALFAEAARRGAGVVEAITTSANQGSLHFHTRLGFAAERVADYAGPGEDRVLFTRAISAAQDLRTGPVLPDPLACILRCAVPGDIDPLLDFWRLWAEGTDREDDRVAVERLIDRDPEAVLLAVEGSRIVGSVIAGWDGWRWHLYRIAVHGDRRRQGIAGALVAAAEQRFAGQGARRVDAMVLEGNTLGQAAWTALGYAPQPAWRRWVRRVDASTPVAGEVGPAGSGPDPHG